jgi:single stranded DNA-binding protein
MLNGIPSLIVGNLGRDPEFQLVNGKQIARISIGVTPRVKKQGQWQDAPALWYRVTIWDTYLAEHVMASLHKGDRVLVYGIVTSDEYQGKINLEMSADAVGVDLNRSDVRVMPRQNNGGQSRQKPGYANRQATRQQTGNAGSVTIHNSDGTKTVMGVDASDPWGAGEFGGNDDEPQF